MKITVVCTGNVNRSPALAIMLARQRPDFKIDSAAVGTKAKPGRPMARPMRELMAGIGFAVQAEKHRSKLLIDCEKPDLIIATAGVHVKRLIDMAYPVDVLALTPPLPDPAFGTHDQVFPAIRAAAFYLARDL